MGFLQCIASYVNIDSLKIQPRMENHSNDDASNVNKVEATGSCKKVNELSFDNREWHIKECAQCLGQMPPVIECILKYLPMMDLNRCLTVCKRWNKIGMCIKRKRKEIFWHCELLIDKTSYLYRSEPSSINIKCSPHEHTYSLHNKSDVKCRLTKALQTARSEPKLALIFVNQRISHFFKPNQRGRKKLHSLSDHLMNLLPKNCLGLGALSYHGVIGTIGHRQQIVEAEVVDGISALFLPELPQVELFPFLIGKSLRKLKIDEIDDEMLTKITNIKPGKELKCLLLFSSDYCGRHTNLVTGITGKLLARQKDGFAVGGGYLENVLALQGLYGLDQNQPRSKAETLGIAICGDNVEAASVIVDGEIESVEAGLAKLKSCNFSEKNLIGFMFSCLSRGKDFYNESNVEADLFRKTFPNAPLLGFFGSAEIGLQKLHNDVRTTKRQKIDVTDLDMMHSYTTIFVLLSFKIDK